MSETDVEKKKMQHTISKKNFQTSKFMTAYHKNKY